MNKLQVASFIFYSIVLAIYTLILLQFVVASPLLLLLGAIPKGFLYSIFSLIKISILPLLCEVFAIFIWIKMLKCLQNPKLNRSPEFEKNFKFMIVMTIILSLVIMFFGKTMLDTEKDRKRYDAETKQHMIKLEQQQIENNKNAAQNCRKVRDLCVTRERISYKRGDTLNESINNAKEACSNLGMRLPTKEEFDIILLPLTTFKNKLEHNPTDEEFVAMERYYKNTLKEYHLQFWHDNFLTSSIENGKAITYKIDLKRYYNHDGCRRVHTKNVSGGVCISETVDKPVIEYHDFNELKDKSKYIEYSLHCVK